MDDNDESEYLMILTVSRFDQRSSLSEANRAVGRASGPSLSGAGLQREAIDEKIAGGTERAGGGYYLMAGGASGVTPVELQDTQSLAGVGRSDAGFSRRMWSAGS